MKTRILALVMTVAGLALTSGSALAWVPASPTLTATFGTASIPVGGSTTLTFMIGNTNAAYKMTDIAFTDTLPAGLVIATPNNLVGSCFVDPLPSAIAEPGTRYVKLTNLMFNGAGVCSLMVDVTGVAPGTQNNVTGAPSGIIFYPNVLTGTPASSSISVIANPSIAAAFSPDAISAGGTTYVTYTITNPSGNIVPLTGVGFTDMLPSGLHVTSTLSPMCGGTLSLSPTSGVALTGASIAPGAQCQFSLMLAVVGAGSYTLTTSHVTSTNGGTGNTATAHLTVAAVAAPTPAPTSTPTPTPTPSETPSPSQSASPSPSSSAAPSASVADSAVAGSSPSTAPGDKSASGDSGSNGIVIVAVVGIAGLGLAGLLVGLFFRRRRREAQSA